MPYQFSQILRTFSLAGLLLSQVIDACAHHAIQVEFDENSLLTIEGEIISLEWAPPHVIIGIESLDISGASTTWLVHAGTPNTLLRRGVNRHSLQTRGTVLSRGAAAIISSPGTIVSFSGYQITNLSCTQICNFWGRDITFPDGRTVSIEGN